MSRCVVYTVLALVPACQGAAATSTPTGAAPRTDVPTAIEVRGPSGMVDARITGDRPCRASVDGRELIVGSQPFVAMLGNNRYAGTDIDGSTVLTRDDEAFARIFPAVPSSDEVALFDAQGVAFIRATFDRAARTVTVRDKGGSPIRELRQTAQAITFSSATGDTTVTGTPDLLLAAVLTATEASPEVRALAACHRLQKAVP